MLDLICSIDLIHLEVVMVMFMVDLMLLMFSNIVIHKKSAVVRGTQIMI